MKRVVDGAQERDGPAVDDVLQGGPFGQLHHEERLAGLVTFRGSNTTVEHPNHVGVLNAGRGAGLGQPPFGRARVSGVAGAVLEHLHGHRLLGVDVTSTKHGREGPRSEHRNELVTVQTPGERRRHRPGWYTQIVTAFPSNVTFR